MERLEHDHRPGAGEPRSAGGRGGVVTRNGRLLGIVGGSGLAYLVLAILMGLLPGVALSPIPPGPGVAALTPQQAAGRQVYVAEGCAYCHTQQVRPLPMDRIFGRPSAPGDFAYQTPELLGSERTGPDLTDVGVRQPSEVWQYIHLYQPRAVVPQSIMPSYRWLFTVVQTPPAGVSPLTLPPGFGPANGVVLPTQRARDLVAYLLSLKQAPIPNYSPSVAAPGGPAVARAGFDYTQLGANVYGTSCAACHGAQGAGVPGVFPALVNDPVVTASDPKTHIEIVLNGLHGKSIGGTAYGGQMPPFGSQLSDDQIAAAIDHERTSWGNHAPTVMPADVANVRKEKK
ncbi:MAG: cbb3-type cytochrome c oxidase subunit II [bacterium]|nr:cbb3-type cytochrome c oxidase subunit II [bacterium]